ncbi:Hsp90 cochaperone STI1 [Ascoidea rubescens DSM 1968]|uniref:TPR-like protein n=1 Tax=Ascoidea rubescens DSM 1968 TaxID=1344418 RepID=A0A1D2VR72_9ASCO|nr:TPR-like protein [Ascoidea rubescens DSM 1968]ODV64106.1 TPR-like protein [Ascoidea rubescens DSM 1968]
MSSADELKALGNKAFSAKKFDEAIDYFTQAIAASSTPNHVLFSNRSACFTSLHKYDKALEDAEKCVEINKTWAKGYNRIAAAHFGLDNLDEAENAFKSALNLDPNNAMAKQGLKQIETRLTEKNSAPDLGFADKFNDPNLIENLKKNPKTKELMKDPAILEKILKFKQNPQEMATQLLSDPKLMTIFGAILGINLDMPDLSNLSPEANPSAPPPEPATKGPEAIPKEDQDPEISIPDDIEMKNPEEKSKSVPPPVSEPQPEPEPEKIIEEPQEDLAAKADAEKQLGNTLYKQRKFDEAITHYDAAWELKNDITYLNNRAAAEFEKKEYETCIKTCEYAVEQGRELRADYKIVAKSFARIGNAYVKLNDLEKARYFFDKSLTEHRTPLVLNKLRSVEKQIKIQEAEAYVNPEKAEEARLLGKDYFTKSDWPKAVEAYTEMIKRAPDDARGYSNRAAALAKLMSFPEAVKDCNLAIQKDPNFVRAYIRKANAQLAMKEYTGCLDTLEVAKEKDSQINAGKSSYEIDQLFQKAMSQRFAAVEGETPEQTMERVSRDPEVTTILQDPVMQSILSQARDNPAALQDHMKNPQIYKKIMTLISAGVIRTR